MLIKDGRKCFLSYTAWRNGNLTHFQKGTFAVYIKSLTFHIHFRNVFRDNVMYKNAESMLSTALFITSKKKV